MFRNEYLHPLELPGLTIPCNLLLAPLAGFTDSPFRRICIENGACFTYTEMVSAEGLIRNGEKTLALLERAPGEDLYGIQLFASNPESAEAAAVRCRLYSPALIDLNCGCPVPKVVKNGAGAALLRDPEGIYRLVLALRRGAGNIPVTVKIRNGWDADSINFMETGAAAAEAGASMVCLHPRTRIQGYSGKADWEHIGALKAALSIPVLGSGDLFTPEAARELFADTGCDGLIFARGAIGNPSIFRRTKTLLDQGEEAPEPSIREKIGTARLHFRYLSDLKGEKRASKEIKKHFAAYTKGLPHSGELRNRLMHADGAEMFEEIWKNYLDEVNILM